MAHQHVLMGAESNRVRPTVRIIGLRDLKDALARGIADFSAMPTHAVFLCLIYPIVGLLLARLTLGYEVLPLLFPLAAGFTLLGPFAAIGLYELSRRREQGLDASWQDAFDVLRSPSRGAIAALGLLLLAIFVIWIAVAQAIYIANFGYEPAASIPDFLHQVFTTPAGRMLIDCGQFSSGFCSRWVLTISVVSFPLLLDRDVGAVEAVLTSVRVVAANPLMMAIWGLIVAGLLVIGSLPFFFGLAVVVPVLGHSTWHSIARWWSRIRPSPSASASAEKPSLCGAISGRLFTGEQQPPGRGAGNAQGQNSRGRRSLARRAAGGGAREVDQCVFGAKRERSRPKSASSQTYVTGYGSALPCSSS